MLGVPKLYLVQFGYCSSTPIFKHELHVLYQTSLVVRRSLVCISVCLGGFPRYSLLRLGNDPRVQITTTIAKCIISKVSKVSFSG